MRASLNYIAWFFYAIIIGIEVSALAFLPVEANKTLPSPGMGITTLALIDGIIFYSWTSITVGRWLPEKVLTPSTKISNFIFFLLMLLAAIVALFIAIALLMLMVSLLMAVPFGTAVYMGVYASFPKGAAAATLSSIMFFKVIFALLIVFGESRLFQDYRKFLMLLSCSFLASFIVSFLHALAPFFLVSITDAIAAIIISTVALIWLLFMFIGAIWGVITLIMDVFGLLNRSADKIRT